MGRRTIWNSGFDITQNMLEWSEASAGEEFRERLEALVKRPGVCVRYGNEDKLRPRSSSVSSISQISPGMAVNPSGAIAKLDVWYDLSCVDADVGDYIQIAPLTVDSGAVAHPVTGVLYDTQRDLDIDGDNIISKVAVEDPEHVTLGKITACVEGSSVTVVTSKNVGHRQIFSTCDPDIEIPSLPVFASGIYTGYDEDLIDPSILSSKRLTIYGASAWIRLHWSGSESDAEIDFYDVMLIPLDESDQELEEQSLFRTVSYDASGSESFEIYNCTFHGLVPGTSYVGKVRARDTTPSHNASEWAVTSDIVAGYEDTPGLISLSLTSSSLHAQATWTPVLGVAAYELCWKSASEPSFDDPSSLYQVLPSGTGALDIPAVSGSVMYIHLRALNRMGVYSAESSGSVTVDEAPPIPISLQLTTGADESYRDLSFKKLQADFVRMTPQTGWILVQWGETGTSGVGSANSFYVEGAEWTTDQWAPGGNAQYLVDSSGESFLILSNTPDTLTVSGTPANGSYSIGPDATYYHIKLEYYDEDSSLVEGSGVIYVVQPNSVLDETPREKRISGLVMGRTYKIAVASLKSLNQSSRSSFSSSQNITIGVTGYTPLVMAPLTVETTNYGVLVKWTPVENAKGYELVYTTDGTPPDFGSMKQPLKRTNKLRYAIYAPVGSRVRVKSRCFDKSGLASSNTTEAAGYAGGISTRQNIKVFPISRLNLDDSDITQDSRTLTKIAMPARGEITKIEVNVSSLSDGPQKIRVYEEGKESGAVSMSISATGFSEQIVSLVVAHDARIVIDAWDYDWTATPPSTFPTIVGSLNVHYNEGSIKIFSPTAL